ncbi:MAG: LysR family transcriptional regulator [Blautia sp.]|nr:LysR family transcriptional regulator [Blautia sp.]
MDKLEYVLTLAEERNLTRAANRLFISQPTLTNYINRLESELGIKLFDRSAKPITVTEAGLIYIEDKKKIQNKELALLAKLNSLKNHERTFIIGAPPVRSAFILPRVLQAFMQKYPNLNITVDNGLDEEVEQGVAAGKIDVAIGSLSTAYPHVHYECVREDRNYLLVPRSAECVRHLSPTEGTIDHPYLLESHYLNEMTMLLSRTGGGHYRMGMIMVEKYGIVPKNTIHCANLNLLYQLAGLGLGFLFATPRPFIESYPQLTQNLAFCTLQHDMQWQKTYLAYQDDNPDLAMVEDFIRLYKEYDKSEEEHHAVSDRT